jgi:hypothetical protein
MEDNVAIGSPDGSWTLIQGKNFLDWDVVTQSFYLEGDKVLERYQGNKLQARYSTPADSIRTVELNDRLVTLAEQSGEKFSVVVLDADFLKIVSRCSIPYGQVVQIEPLASNQVLVKTDEPSALLRYRLDGNACRLEEGRSDTMDYFEYREETGDILLSGAKGSELIKITEDGFKSVVKTPYPWAEVTKQGRWFASKNGALMEIWPDGKYWIETLQARHFATENNAMLFNTESGWRVVSDSELPSEAEFWISPSGRSGAGGYLVVDHNGQVKREVLPAIDDSTISEIVSKSPYASSVFRKGTEERLRGYGLFWHDPIMASPYRDYIYGRSLISTLTRVDVANNRLEILPVPSGNYSLDVHSAQIWIYTQAPSFSLAAYSIAENKTKVISGSHEYFSSDQEERPYDGRGLAFSLDGKNTLAFNASGKWALIADYQLSAPESNVTQNLKFTDAVSEAQAWLVTTRDDRLIRLSRDGKSILNQAPLRPGVKKLSIYTSQGLILVGTDEGVALHDSATLLEISLIPGSGEFQTVDGDNGILLAVESREVANQWKIYRLPEFGDNLLSRVDELRITPPTLFSSQ